MPVRCGTEYSRPYRVVWHDRNGRLRSRPFHWPGPAKAWRDWLVANKYEGVELLKNIEKGKETRAVQR